jgi:DNA-binding XRE family transcriptional regulator
MEHALARFRANAGLSRKDVAKAVGTSRQTIHRIEAGNQQPSWDLAAKLIGISGGRLSADDFMPKAPQ